MLKKFYAFYHKKHWCYAELFRAVLFCNAVSGKTIISSAGAGGITLNPAMFAVLTGFGLVVKGVASFKQCGKKAEKADLVRIAYKKILDAIRFFLRGDPSDENTFSTS